MELLEGDVLADLVRQGPLSVSPDGIDRRWACCRRCPRSTPEASSTAISSRRTSSSRRMASSCSTSAWPGLSSKTRPDGHRDYAGRDADRHAPLYGAGAGHRRGGADARADLFAAGAILFEMLAGGRPSQGRTIVEVMRATMSEQPPALGGSPAVAAIDRVIRQALAKRPAERSHSADVMAEELRAAAGLDTGSTTARAQAMTRLVVLPFRILRPDAETDFLAFSLADAITTSLSGINSLVVRSSAVAGRFLVEAPDLKALASEADVDRVVMGTLLRSGDQVRAVAQLVEAPNGRLITSNTVTGGPRRPVSPAGQHRSPRRRGAVAAAHRVAGVLARLAAESGGLRALPARQRAGPDLRRAGTGARSCTRNQWTRSRLRAGVGAPGPVPPRHRQVRRQRARQREPRPGGLRSRAGAQPRADDRAQVLRQPRGRHRPGHPRDGAPARTGLTPRQRPGALCRAGARAAAIAACSSSRSSRTTRRAASIPTFRPVSSRR